MSWSDSVWAVVKSPNFCMPGKVQPPTDKNGRVRLDRVNSPDLQTNQVV
jgi:hypothetical protein